MKIRYIRDSDKKDISLPKYMTVQSAGMDLCAAIDNPSYYHLGPGKRVLIPTGFAIAVPIGYEAQIRPRSGLALKNGISVLNTPGTIDSDYRGELGVILINHSNENFTILRGDRIAQLVISPIVRVELELTDTLPDTERGYGGFGHTGKTIKAKLGKPRPAFKSDEEITQIEYDEYINKLRVEDEKKRMNATQIAERNRSK